MEKVQLFQTLLARGSSDLIWQGRAPYCQRFGDIYFSPEDGLAESRYVFLTGNALPSRWIEHSKSETEFLIGEMGFGTGLNFLATVELWKDCLSQISELNSKSEQSQSWLHYYACDLYPISQSAMQAVIARIIEQWPALSSLAQKFLERYRDPFPGWQLMKWPEFRVSLSFYAGEGADFLRQLPVKMHSWYLDGFAPSRNPAMWEELVMERIAARSHQDCRFATFTSAGKVRRALEKYGFTVTKKKGFGKKREMLTGVMSAEKSEGWSQRVKILEPWFEPSLQEPLKKVAIIGGGIAGASLAYSLGQRGVQVLLLDAAQTVGAVASGNEAAVIMPLVAKSLLLPLSSLQHSAWHFALQRMQDLKMPPLRGLIKRAHSEEEWERMQHYASSFLNNGDHFLLRKEKREIYFKNAGWLEPAKWIQNHLDAFSSMITIKLGSEVQQLQYSSALQRWILTVKSQNRVQEIAVNQVVLASGATMNRFGPESWLPIRKTKGQLARFANQGKQNHFQEVLAYDGYVIPVDQQHLYLGATFERDYQDLSPSEPANLRMAELFSLAFPEHRSLFFEAQAGNSEDLRLRTSQSRVSERAQSPDHFPFIGPMPSLEAYCEDYAALADGQPWTKYPPARYVPGLFTILGLGSRGMTWGPLMGELLAAQMNNEAYPLSIDFYRNLHCGRFIVRKLKRPISSS